jgi:cytochrome o ubiquinol oxidase subunit II
MRSTVIKKYSRGTFCLLVAVFAASLVLLTGCSEVNNSFLDPKGPIAAAQKTHFISVTLYSMIAAGPVFILVPYILWRYRYKNKKARYTPNWEFSGLLDSVMWGVPLAIIIVLSSQLWQSTKTLDPYLPIESDVPAVKVQVVGLDWKWLFIYPEYGVATVGELAFAADRPVSMVLTSDTVMQSFLISALAGQIYVMPGMQTKLHVKADAPGIFEGENTQFNGVGFPKQKFKAVAMTGNEFDQWMTKVRAEGVALSETTYKFIANRSTAEEVYDALGSSAMPEHVTYFNEVPSSLYADIIARYRTGKAIPMSEQPGGALYSAKDESMASDSAEVSVSGEGVAP